MALLAVVGVEYVGPQLPILRGGLAFLCLSLVSGFLLLRLAGIAPCSRAEMIVYTVGVSLVSLMAFGTIINFGLKLGGSRSRFRNCRSCSSSAPSCWA